MPAPALTPFVGALRAEATARLTAAVRELVGAADADIELTRLVSPRTEGPSRIVIRRGPAVLGLVLGGASGAGWQAGPLTVTVQRRVDNVAPTDSGEARGWLRRLATFFTETPADERHARGKALAALHHTWATLRSVEDRDYRHVEFAHNGVTAKLRASFRCNQDCHFCWEGRDWPQPPDTLVATWLDELAASGARQVTLCGGEPTLNPRLHALVETAARTYGMAVHMNTNAIKLRDRAFATRLRDAGLGSVLVSFHSADPAVSDAMTRAPGTWRRTVEGLHGALEAGLTVVVNCVVESTNVEGLAAHARFVREQFVERHPDNPVRMVNYSQPGAYYDSRLYVGQIVPIDLARPHVVEAARILHEAGVLLEITGTCGFASCIAATVPELVPWRSGTTLDPTSASARVHDPEPCRACAARSHCVGVRREYFDRWGDRGLVPFAVLPTSDWYERLSAAGLGAHWGE